MKPNKRNISRVPIKFILNPDISEESDLSSDADESELEDNHTNEPAESDSSDIESEDNGNESDISGSDDDMDTSSNARGNSKLKWVTKDSQNVTAKVLPFTGINPAPLPPKEPIDYFRDVFTDDLLLQIVEESNKYALQVDIAKPLNLSKNELEQFIGIIFFMSIVSMPSARDYWDQYLKYDKISQIMPVRRFERIKRFLHCNDNLKMPKDCPDKLYKIRPIIDALKSHFNSATPTEYLCIDEQMVPFKGRSKLKQYNPQKPKKWGYKLYVLTSPNGQVFDFEIHTGSIEKCPDQPDLQASGNIVMRLLSCIPRNKNHKLFIDNWYTGVPLVTTLMEQGIAVVGTVRSNRLRGCVLSSDKEMRKKGRGSSELKVCTVNGNEVRAIRWFDNRAVTILTTYEAIEPVTQVRRWDRKNKTEIQVDCPSAVVTYNQNMGGVDLLDGMLSYYRIPLKSKKWYHRLIWHFFYIAVVQGWILHRRDTDDNISLKCFKVSVATSLINQGKSSRTGRGRPSQSIESLYHAKRKRGPTAPIPNASVRTDGFEHFPIFVEKKGRCRRPECTGYTFIECEKCNVRLCLTKSSNCFKQFHES